MTRAQAIAQAEQCFDSGAFRALLARRLAQPTESQNPDRAPELAAYLEADIRPAFEAMGFTCRTLTHPKALAPFLYAERIEDPALPTVLGYGHGDVIRGLEKEWKQGLSPWTLTESEGRWYGRGIADNKGQHTVNMEALRLVLETRGKLGFNTKYLIEMGEETGSMGLRELCEEHRALLAADLLIASDGPRLSAERPTLFLGARGSLRRFGKRGRAGQPEAHEQRQQLDSDANIALRAQHPPIHLIEPFGDGRFLPLGRQRGIVAGERLEIGDVRVVGLLAVPHRNRTRHDQRRRRRERVRPRELDRDGRRARRRVFERVGDIRR